LGILDGGVLALSFAVRWQFCCPRRGRKNRLVNETSPYLLLHKDNPVEWYPWGVEAFERAKRENKPVFVSIGYSACHWCHVMARESFEDRQIAELLNERFRSAYEAFVRAYDPQWGGFGMAEKFPRASAFKFSPATVRFSSGIG
jgi:uncharacterized protein YyaL (SSP411 family)